MPVYVFECQTCGHTEEHNLPMDERDAHDYRCPRIDCVNGFPLKRIIARPNIQEDLVPYWDENLTNDATESGGLFCPSYDDRDHKLDGVFIKSRRQKKELMKRWGYEYRK